MLLAEKLLAPLAGETRTGPSLRYDPVYDQIKQARREDPFEDPPLRADWAQVERLATQVLTERSKDLWIAAWLCEALLHRKGIPGLATGLELVWKLVRDFWDDVHPQASDSDLELRAAPLAWIGGYLDVAVRLAPLNEYGHDYLAYRASRAVPTEEEAKTDKEKRARRETSLAEGKLDPETFEAEFAATGKDWYRKLVSAVDTSLERTASIERFCDERFGEDAPGFHKLRDALAEFRVAASSLLARKLEREPDTAEPGPGESDPGGPVSNGAGEAGGEAVVSHNPATPGGDTVLGRTAALTGADALAAIVGQDGEASAEGARAAGGGAVDVRSGSPPEGIAAPGARVAPPLAAAPVANAPPPNPAANPPEPTSREDAAKQIAAAARFLRAQAPADPTPYLLLRGFRWGELRVNGAALDPRLLEAPPTELRTRLKTLLLEGRWAELLETADTVMASPFGRGWLDLQRYAVTALEALGADYAAAADAVRSALRWLLHDLPELVDATLMDDSPTANRDTIAWLAAQGLLPARDGDDGATTTAAFAATPASAPAGAAPESVERILGRLGTSEPQRAIALLMSAADRERSERSRFLRKADAARIMVETGHAIVALPILRRMLEQVDQHKLEDWEDGRAVAGTLGLLHRCLGQLGLDPKEREALYLRVCRLDPLQAMEVEREANAGAGQAEA